MNIYIFFALIYALLKMTSFFCTVVFNSFHPVHSSLENNSHSVSTTSRLSSWMYIVRFRNVCHLYFFAYLSPAACTVLRASLRHSYASIIATAAAEIVRPLRLLSVAIWLTCNGRPHQHLTSRLGALNNYVGQGRRLLTPLAHIGLVNSEVSIQPVSPRGGTPLPV